MSTATLAPVQVLASCARNEQFSELFRQAQHLPSSPAREQLMRVYAIWKGGDTVDVHRAEGMAVVIVAQMVAAYESGKDAYGLQVADQTVTPTDNTTNTAIEVGSTIGKVVAVTSVGLFAFALTAICEITKGVFCAVRDLVNEEKEEVKTTYIETEKERPGQNIIHNHYY